jgi:hypothetical protein
MLEDSQEEGGTPKIEFRQPLHRSIKSVLLCGCMHEKVYTSVYHNIHLEYEQQLFLVLMYGKHLFFNVCAFAIRDARMNTWYARTNTSV